MGDTPHYLNCPVARRNRDFRTGHLPGGHVIRRTGRTKPRTTRRPGQRTLDTSHEYRCTCGHVGWTTHMDILQRPLTKEARAAADHARDGEADG